MGEQQADALRSGRVGRARPHRRCAAGADDHRARGDDAIVLADQPGASVLRAPQRTRSRPLEHGDARLLGDQRRQLANDAPPGGAAAGVHDSANRVPALQAEREPPGAVGVKAHAERLQVAHAVGRLAGEDLGGRASHQRAAGELGVAQVQLRAVVGRERRGEAALRPVASRLREWRGGNRARPMRARARRRAPRTARPRPRRRLLRRSHARPRVGARTSPTPYLARRGRRRAAICRLRVR